MNLTPAPRIHSQALASARYYENLLDGYVQVDLLQQASFFVEAFFVGPPRLPKLQTWGLSTRIPNFGLDT